MLKKILLVSSMAALSSAVLASTTPYVGLGTGVIVNTASNNLFNSYRGVPFNIFAGYGGVVNSQNFYIAGEINATFVTADISSNGNFLKTTYGYGASIIPGVMLSDHTLVFGRVGLLRTRFTNEDLMQTGAQFGLGMQTSVTQNVDVRGEYDFTAYRSVNHYGFTTSPRSDAFNVALVYKFD